MNTTQKTIIKISPKNSKLGKIPNISIIPVKDCGNAEYCRKDCYALKAWRQYPAVRTAWKVNSKAFRNDIDQAFVDLYAWLNKKQPEYFRIHVAGDFLNQEHVDKYSALARLLPGVKFLAFTKMHDLFYDQCPDNLQIILSVWPGMELPKRQGLPFAWVQDGTETRIPVDAIECPGICEDCGMCWQLSKIGRDVTFHSH